MNFWLLFQGVLLGWGVAIPIGPINIEIARRTLRHRTAAGMAVGWGAVTGDVCWAVITGLALVPHLKQGWITTTLSIAGAALLVWLAYLCVKGSFKPHEIGPGASGAAPTDSLFNHFRTGLLMATISPYNLAFWLTAVPTTVLRLTPEPGRDLPWVAAGVFLGAISWSTSFALVVHAIGKLGKEKWLRLADWTGAALLLLFAWFLVWQVVKPPAQEFSPPASRPSGAIIGPRDMPRAFACLCRVSHLASNSTASMMRR